MDIDKYRRETQGIQNVVHFNNAGSSLMPKPVFDTVSRYHEYELNWGGYETADTFRSQLENFYQNIVRLIHCDKSEVAFMESATHAWGMAFFSIPFQKGDIILTSRIEYASNYIAYLQMQKRKGVQVKPIQSNSSGETDPEALEKELKKGGVKLISITHIPTNGGIVNPAEEIGSIARKYGILYLLDACQSAGQYPLDVTKLQCDFLSATGRKYLRGPRGTGFLYVNKEILKDIEPWSLDLHSAEWTASDKFKVRQDARKFEKWECNPGLKLGLSRAAEYCHEVGIETIWKRVSKLSDELRVGLRTIPGIEVLDIGRIQSGIVTFRSSKMEAKKIKKALSLKNINTSVAVASGTLLDMTDRSIDSAVRASLHYYNSEDEVSLFLETLSELLKTKK